MKLSVIITVYNREKYIARCLESILNQDLEEYEMIVIDDGSSDGSWALIEEYQGRFPEKIRAFHQKNAGVSAARNAGLSHAKGEYIAFVDSDDWVEENCFGTLYREAKAHDCDVLLFDEDNVYADGTRKRIRAFYPCEEDLTSGKVTAAQYVVARPGPVNKWIRREVYFRLKEGFAEGRIYEDLALYPRLGTVADEIYYLACPYYQCYQSENSIMRIPQFQEKTLDIFPAVYELKEALEERFPKEAEYIWWRHLLLLGSKRFLNLNRKDLSDRAADEMRRSYPDWKQNPYVQRESGGDRLLTDLLYRKKYGRIRFLAGLRKLRKK